MRHLLVKLFVLDYFFKVFGIRFIIARVNTIFIPIFLLTGLAITLSASPYILWFLYLLNLIVVFFGFIYFRIKPVEWEELDNFQKFKYGSFTKLKGRKYFEWVKIFHNIRAEYFS